MSQRTDVTRPASVRTLTLTFAVLLALTLLTTLLALVNLGPFNLVLALVIAGAKATLIGLFFMHLRGSLALIRLVPLVAVFWLALLLGGTLGDLLTR